MPCTCRVREPGEKGTTHVHDRPHRGLPHQDPQRQLGVPRRGRHALLQAEGQHFSDILVKEGYIASWTTADATVGKSLVVKLKYGPNRERSIAGIRRVSKPGLRVYARSTELPKVLGGLGIAIISTSSGLLTDRQAAKKKVGGEVLAYVW